VPTTKSVSGFLCFVTVSLAGQLVAAAPPDWDFIIAELQRRQDAVRTARCSWDSTDVGRPILVELPKGDVGIGPPGPKEEHRNLTFAFDGPKHGYTYYASGRRDGGPPDYAKFDGAVNAEFSPPTSDSFGTGLIGPRKEFREFNNWNLWPMLLAFRPFAQPGIGMPADQLQCEVDRTTLGGRECAVARWRKGPDWYSVFVDEVDWCTIVRLEKHWGSEKPSGRPDDHLMGSIDVKYTRTKDNVPYPSEWTLHFDNKGQHVTTGVMKKIELNVDCPASDFSGTPFPVGTLVHDRIEGAEYWQRANGRIEKTIWQEHVPPEKLIPGTDFEVVLTCHNSETTPLSALRDVRCVYFLNGATEEQVTQMTVGSKSRHRVTLTAVIPIPKDAKSLRYGFRYEFGGDPCEQWHPEIKAIGK
jgi:hypothetical protein